MDAGIASAILVGLIAGIAILDSLGPQLGLFFPLIAGALTGLVLGDVHTALILSATLQLAFIGTVAIGGALPPNATVGTIVGVAFGVIAGKDDPTAALALGLPAAVLFQQLDIAMNTGLVALMHRADRVAEDGNLRGIRRLHLIGTGLYFLEGFVPVFLVVAFGAELAQHLVSDIPDWLSTGMKVAAGVLPAVGFAMLLRIIWSPQVLGFFIVGFGLASYLKLPVLGAAIIGVGLLLMILSIAQRGRAEAEAVAADSTGSKVAMRRRLPEQNSVFFRHALFQTSINFERLQGLGFTYALSPVLKRLYGGSKEQMSAAIDRHLVFFNTNPLTGSLIVGAAASIEEDIAEHRAQPNTVVAMKASFMGPLAGIGDSLFWFTLYPLAASIGAAFATQGNGVGPILAFLIFNVIAIPFKYFGIAYGYRLGGSVLSRIKGERLQQLMQSALQFAAFVLGALVASLVVLQTGIKIEIQGTKLDIQQTLDDIVPQLLPLLATLLAFWLLRKKVNPAVLIVIYLIAAIALTAAQVFTA